MSQTSTSTKTSSQLIKELSFYRRYHYNPVNIAIHIICIPLILLSSSYNLTALRLPVSIADKIGIDSSLLPYLNLAVVSSVNYAIHYIYLDPSFGLFVGAALLAASLKFSTLSLELGSHGHHIAWYIWGFGWIAQFIGHGVFEKRAPALFDNLNQALVLAPYFAVFEVAHMLGFRRQVMDDVDAEVVPEIMAFRASLKTKSKAKAN